MNVFLSYASEDRATAADIRHALEHDGHDVFFDRDDLPPGEDFHARIRRGIERSDLFVFLVSPQSLDAGSYTLNELEIAQRTWATAAGRLLPVLLAQVDMRALPALLRSVTFLEPEGNVPAAVADAVYRIARARRRRRFARVAPVAALGLVAAAAAYLYAPGDEPRAVRVSGDGAEAVLIPAGVFVMGDDESAPRREVYVDAFYVDRYEITVGALRRVSFERGRTRRAGSLG